jgi:hypothetical protein
VRGERAYEHAAVARFHQQAPARKAVERGAKRVAPDVEFDRERNLAEMLTRLESPFEDLTLEFVLEGLHTRCRLPADHRDVLNRAARLTDRRRGYAFESARSRQRWQTPSLVPNASCCEIASPHARQERPVSRPYNALSVSQTVRAISIAPG